jgi:HSP20 family protein
MTLIKNAPIFNTLPRFFDDFFTREVNGWEGAGNNSVTNSTIPSVNIVESTDAFAVEMAAPGMDKEDFLVELDNEILKISSQKETKTELKEGHRYSRQEFSYQSFERTFRLPRTVVDASKIHAKYENGLLRVLIPKREEAKALTPRQIKIS